MKRSTHALGILALFTASAAATSLAPAPAKRSLAEDEPVCEVTARYIEEQAVGKLVYWKFQGATARAVPADALDCTPVVGEFQLRIFGAKYSQTHRFVYPEYVPNRVEANYRMRLVRRTRKTGDVSVVEWTVSSWTEGFIREGSR